jgi:hypothetical protein
MVFLLAACGALVPAPPIAADPAPGSVPVPPAVPRDALLAYEGHAALLAEACKRFEALGPGPRNQTIDAMSRDGTVTWSSREIMGAPIETHVDAAPTPALLAELGASVAEIAWWQATLTAVGAVSVHRWELTSDGGGYHPWILIRSDSVFSWHAGPTLVCRMTASSHEPDPLLGEGCVKMEETGRWWRCGGEVSMTAPLPTSQPANGPSVIPGK